MTSKNFLVKRGNSTKKGTAKYGNKPFWLNIHTGQTANTLSSKNNGSWTYFDSQLEFGVWMQLKQICIPKGVIIHRQYQFTLSERNEYFAPLTWDCDFVLQKDDLLIPIECKGKWLLYSEGELSAFRHLLRAFYAYNPSLFKSLIIVDTEQWLIPGIKNKCVEQKSDIQMFLGLRM